MFWLRHLSAVERRELVADLRRVLIEWRATARVLADPELTAELSRPLPGDDHGEVVGP
ncbi:hypothetical protein AB0F71_20825 [Kitasatospora sp. NPDC028055]|uniref:hypothetical protein n=1 Tax=Kitasatospora sp. NPDC028055 TaxID=3155653 RepID=UPI0033E784FE